jgi:YbbR domain-containing protein
VKIKTRSIKFTKLIAVLCALALWFYVAGQGQMTAQNSIEADLNYIKLGDNLTVSGPDKVTVKRWGTVSEAEQMEQAYVDLSGLGPGTYTLPVHLQQTNRALLAKVEPDKVKVVIAELEKNTIAIVPRSQTKLAEGFELTDIFTVPEQCAVQGEQSAVSRVYTVAAPVTLESTGEMQSLTVDLQALDKNGNIVKEVRLIPAKATVYAVVNQKLTSIKLPIKVVTQGSAAEGFETGEISIEPQEAMLVGSPDLLGKITQIETKPVDINGSSRSITVQAELNVLEGVKVYPLRHRSILRSNRLSRR